MKVVLARDSAGATRAVRRPTSMAARAVQRSTSEAGGARTAGHQPLSPRGERGGPLRDDGACEATCQVTRMPADSAPPPG
eukprot:2129481-Prymnesium_polylepis.1